MNPYYLYGAFAAVILIVSFIVISRLRKCREEKEKIDRANAERLGRVNEIKSLVERESDPIKKRILENHLSYLMVDEAENRLVPLIEEAYARIRSHSTKKRQDVLKRYKDELSAAKAAASNLLFYPEVDLTDEERLSYKRLYKNYMALFSCKGKWKVLDESPNDEYKSSAMSAITRTEVYLLPRSFDRLSSPNLVPTFSSGRNALFIYPRFIIIGDSIKDFRVAPLSDLDIEVSPLRFIENEYHISDAELLGKTYAHVNIDGSPDRRFADNEPLPILKYAIIHLSTLYYPYIVSNYAKAVNFKAAYDCLRDGGDYVGMTDKSHASSDVSDKAQKILDLIRKR